jgi:uncharacterized membrane protein YkoI
MLTAALVLSAGAVVLPAHAKSSAEWQALAAQATVTLQQAMEKAVAAVPGQVIEAKLDKGDGVSPRYEVEVITPTHEHVEVWVNVSTGQANQHKNEGKAKSKDLKRLGEAKTTIAAALQAATAHTPGKAVGAELDSHWGTTSYQVDVLQADGTLMEVKIDAATGKVLRSKKD